MRHVVLPQNRRQNRRQRIRHFIVVQQHVRQAGVPRRRHGPHAVVRRGIVKLDGHDDGDALGALGVRVVRPAAAALDDGSLAAHVGEQGLHVDLRLERLLGEDLVRVEALGEVVGGVEKGGADVGEGRRGGGGGGGGGGGEGRGRVGRVPGLRLGEGHEVGVAWVCRRWMVLVLVVLMLLVLMLLVLLVLVVLHRGRRPLVGSRGPESHRGGGSDVVAGRGGGAVVHVAQLEEQLANGVAEKGDVALDILQSGLVLGAVLAVLELVDAALLAELLLGEGAPRLGGWFGVHGGGGCCDGGY